MSTQHVVIVDDSDLNLRLMGSIAREIPGVVTHVCNSSADALAASRDQAIDCFIVDYHMPAPDGIELIRLLRENPALALVPMVMVTGEGERAVRYRALDAGANDFIQKPIDRREFLARVTTHLSLQAARRQLALHVDELEATLRDEAGRTRAQAHRLEALWRVANNPSLADAELLTAMLREGAAGLRPGQPFAGLFGRQEGTEIVVDAFFDGGVAPEGRWLAVGDRLELGDSTFSEVVRSGATRSWQDTERDPQRARRSNRVRHQKWRSLISTPVRAGGSTYFLSFASVVPADAPFTAEDLTYVELLASFFATHVQARWQSNRIRYQSEHDALTGLRNRAQFRSAGRAALMRDGSGAIAVANIDRFRDVNERYGSLIGDAILVEVGAALAEQAGDAEFVARLNGDAFGIYLGGERSRAALERRVAEFGAAFDHPFSTGDREGKQTVSVTATIGVARAPDDGTTFEDLLAHADAAVFAAKARQRGQISFFHAQEEA